MKVMKIMWIFMFLFYKLKKKKKENRLEVVRKLYMYEMS